VIPVPRLLQRSQQALWSIFVRIIIIGIGRIAPKKFSILSSFLLSERLSKVRFEEKLPSAISSAILLFERRIQFRLFRGLRISEARVESAVKQFFSTVTVTIPVLPDHVALARVGLEALQASAEAADAHG
jgi:hypothetical protein